VFEQCQKFLIRLKVWFLFIMNGKDCEENSWKRFLEYKDASSCTQQARFLVVFLLVFLNKAGKKKGFIGANKTLEGAKQMARRSIALKQ
jgi:hypothetical protein